MTASDVLFIAAILFISGTVFLASYLGINTMYNTILENPQINSTETAVSAIRASQAQTERFDYVFFAIFIGLCLGMLITSWFIAGNPIFMFIYFLIWLIGVITSSVFAYVWDTISTMTVFNTSISHFPMTNHILTNLPVYITIIGFIGIVIMFAKPNETYPYNS